MGHIESIFVNKKNKFIVGADLSHALFLHSDYKRHKAFLNNFQQRSRQVVDQHVLLPLQRPDKLKEALDDYYVEITIVAGDYQLLFEKDGSKDLGQIILADGQVEKMAELKHF